MKTIIYDCLPSTNDELKKLKNPDEDVFLIARSQKKGRGTKGRSFISAEGGVYASLLRLYPCKTKDAFTLTAGAALAVVRTLAAFDVKAEIKWPNDVFVSGKKICGILVENVFEGDEVARSIIGIGVNVNNPIADEIADIAISVKRLVGRDSDLNVFYSTLAFNLYREFDMDEYVSYCKFLGKQITVIKGNESHVAVGEKILPNGNLLLRSGEILSAAEISIRQ